MQIPRVILAERSGRWSAALASQLPSGAILVQTRGHQQCAAELALAPASLVALELTSDNAVQVARFTHHVIRHHPWSTVVILADDDAAEATQLAREAGATLVFHSPRALEGCRQTLERHWQRLPQMPREFAASVWDALPWKIAATA